MLKILLITSLSLFLINSNAFAECRCVCMNSQAVRICDNATDFKIDCYSNKMRCK